MLFAAPIMRVVGVPVLQLVGWVFSALQAALGVQAIISSVPAPAS
jgi:small neutral amino acid transporter SnatA (MarC family)